MLQIVIHTIIITAIILLSSKFAVSGKLKIWECSSNYHYYYFPILWALALRRVAVKEVEILRQERKYRGPIMMMVLFRIGLATFYIGFLLNIFFSPLVALL
jgi:CPA2 family monovalent cation:H+ antiporter-2